MLAMAGFFTSARKIEVANRRAGAGKVRDGRHAAFALTHEAARTRKPDGDAIYRGCRWWKLVKSEKSMGGTPWNFLTAAFQAWCVTNAN